MVASYDAAEAARTPGDGLVRSTVPLLFHDEDIDDGDRDPLFTVSTLAAGIRRDCDEQRSRLANDVDRTDKKTLSMGQEGRSS